MAHTCEGALDALDDIFYNPPCPVFERVYRGEPLGLGIGEKFLAYWYDGEEEKSMTLRNVMVDERFMVCMYWLVRVEEEPRRALELDIWNTCRNVQAALRANSTLRYQGNANATDLKIDLANAGWRDIGSSRYRSIWFSVIAEELEAEGITP